jgi:hypothetical protein
MVVISRREDTLISVIVRDTGVQIPEMYSGYLFASVCEVEQMINMSIVLASCRILGDVGILSPRTPF